ncbi:MULTISPECIES: hypothetical protein [Bacteroides]|uniref:hypothetical protein n=1 Tax=Bacteroides TaxID=816 RepID=UPI00259D18C1|nr:MULTISPECIES: hypothetical protein [Bacteroides]
MKGLFTLLLLLPISILTAQTDSIGIYMKNGDDMQKIEPIKYTQTKSNALAGALTMGIASTTMKTIFRGSKSDNIATSGTKFYLYFTSNIDPTTMYTYFAFTPDHTPKDFILAKFISKRTTRELMVGKVNIYAGITMGVADETGIELQTTKIREGPIRNIIYKRAYSG